MLRSFHCQATKRVFLSYLLFTLLLSVIFPALLSYYPGIPFGTQKDWFPYNPQGYDLSATYQAAANISKGLNPYLHQEEVGKEFIRPGSGIDGLNRYSYPPLQAYLLFPLTLLSFDHAYLVWSAVTVLLTLVSLFVLSRLYCDPFVTFISGVLVYIQSSFVYFQIERGQTDAVVLLFVVLMAYCLKNGKSSTLAGFFCAIAALVKVTPAIFLVSFIARKDIKALLSFSLTCIAAVLVTGIDQWIYWINIIAPYYSKYRVGFGVDHSFNYLMTSLFDESTSDLTGQALAFGFFLIFCIMLMKHPDKEKFFLFEMAVFSILMNVSTPWSANYKILILPFVLLCPYAIVQHNWIIRKLSFNLWPIVFGLIAIVPYASIYLFRFMIDVVPLFSSHPDVGRSMVLDLMMDGPREATFLDILFVDRKVSVGFLFILTNLLVVYFCGYFQNKSLQKIWFFRFVYTLWCGVSKVAAIIVLVISLVSVVVVLTRSSRAHEITSFARPLDLLKDERPFTTSFAGVGPVELQEGVQYRWGYGPRTLVAFIAEEEAKLTLEASFDTPIEMLSLSINLNEVPIAELKNVPTISSGTSAVVVTQLIAKKGINSIHIDYAKWNWNGYLVSQSDSRPLAARIRSFTLKKVEW